MPEGPGRGRPRSRAADRAILMQSFRLLAEQGYSAMTIEGVAAAAGVGKATIYRRYADKRDLVIATLSMLRQEAPPLVDTGDVEHDLLVAVGETLAYFEQLSAFTLIGTLLAQSTRNPEFLALMREHIGVPRRAALRALLQAGVDRGELRADLEAETVVDLVMGSILARFLAGLELDQPWVESMVRAVLDGAREPSTQGG